MTGKQAVGSLSIFCLLCLGSPWARADEPTQTAVPAETAPAASAAPAATTDATARPDGSPVDLAILLDEHMAIVRLRVRRGETPFFQSWQQFVEGKFNSADKDHNGTLDAEEFKAVKPLLPTAASANNQNVDRFGRRRNDNDTQQIVVDPMSDEATGGQLGPGVTCQQFVESLRTTTNGPVQIRGQFQASPASRALFARLDADHDAKLSVSECERAFDALQPLDLVEADSFAPFQLTGGNPGVNGFVGFAGQAGQPGARSARVRLAVKLLRISNSGSSLAWADRIGQHFAPPGPKSNVRKNLLRAVMLYDEATFATMDADGDGTLDREELTHLAAQATPNLELNVDLSRQGPLEATGVHLDPAFRFDPASHSGSTSHSARLATGSEEVELTSAGSDGPNARRQRPDLVSFLKQFDRDNNDYLEERELRQFNAVGLMALDANGDGKLYFDEIKVYVDAQAEAAAFRLVVALVDHDHDLFEALDTNRDGQLGRRELRQLTARLTAWDRNGDGQLAFDEVPRLYTIRVAQDEPRIPDNPFGFGNGVYFVADGRMRAQSNPGPVWFKQMDRNADGDISRREFLGTAAQFRQLDADGDQLIDPEEASRATPTAVPAAAATAPASVPSSSAPPTDDAADDAEES